MQRGHVLNNRRRPIGIGWNRRGWKAEINERNQNGCLINGGNWHSWPKIACRRCYSYWWWTYGSPHPTPRRPLIAASSFCFLPLLSCFARIRSFQCTSLRSSAYSLCGSTRWFGRGSSACFGLATVTRLLANRSFSNLCSSYLYYCCCSSCYYLIIGEIMLKIKMPKPIMLSQGILREFTCSRFPLQMIVHIIISLIIITCLRWLLHGLCCGWSRRRCNDCLNADCGIGLGWWLVHNSSTIWKLVKCSLSFSLIGVSWILNEGTVNYLFNNIWLKYLFIMLIL